MFTSLFKDRITDKDKKLDKEKHSVKSGRVLSTGAFVPIELGCMNVFTYLAALQTPNYWNFIWRFPHIGMISY